MTTVYKTHGVCSREMQIDTENGIITDVRIIGGCPGNLYGLSKLVKNMEIDEVITRLRGISCGEKSTSCPDQLAIALEEIKANEKSA